MADKFTSREPADQADRKLEQIRFKRKRAKRVFTICILSLICLFTGRGHTQDSPNGEVGHGNLIIAIDDDYAPQTFLNLDGQPAGIFVDIWRLWSKKTGNAITFLGGNWRDSLANLKSGRANIHSGLFYSDPRGEWISFSKPFYGVGSYLFSLVGSDKIDRQKTMAGKKIGVILGSFQEEYLRQKYPKVEVVTFTNRERMIRAVLNGEIDALLAEGPAMAAVLDRYGLTGQFHVGNVMFRKSFHAGVLKGNDPLLLLVNKGFNAISEQELAEIEKRWIKDPKRQYFESELTYVADAIPALVWISKDPECNDITGNRYVNDLFNVAPSANVSQTAEKKGKAVKIKHLKPDGTELQPEELPMQQSIARGEPVRDVEFSYLLPDGRQIFVIGNAVPLYDEHGSIKGSVGAFLDITKTKEAAARLQKHTLVFLFGAIGFVVILGIMLIVMARMWRTAKRNEAALRKSEEKYRALVESTPDGIVLLDLARNMITCNRGFSRLFGYTEGDIKGKSVRLIHQSDEEFHQFGEMAYGSIERTGSYQGEVYFRKKDGTLFPAESVTSPIEKEGLKTGYVGIIRDISLRKKAEEERLKNEKDLRESQRIAHLGSWRLDLDTHEVLWTEELYKMYGFDPTLPPPPYTEHVKLFTPESWLLLSTSLEKTRDTGISYELELEMVREDGSKGWMWVRGEAVTDSKGKTIGLWGAAQDITERKGMEEALRKSEERLRLSIDASGLSFWEWYPETGNIHFDEKWQKSLGYDSGEMTFDTQWWKTHIHPDSKPAFEKALKDYLDGKNPRYDLEYQIKTKTGEWRWGRAVGECIEFGKQGQPKLFLGTHEDITAAKTPEAQSARGEKELKWLFRSMINAFVLFDSVFDENGEFVSYRFVFINEAYERITGVKNEEVRGKTVHEVWPETEPAWIEKYGEVAVTGVPQSFEMYHHPTKKLYDCNVYRPWDNPDRFCVIFDDITERKQIEAELHHARKMESIGVLAGGVAHDFNNILGIVLGNAELALEDVPEWNPAHEFIKEIRSATLRAKDVVQELLRFSRKSTGQKKPLEIGPLVKESMKSLRATIPSSVDFALNIPEQLHYIHADPTQIHQILMNLASNAADAMEERGILKVTLENVVLEKGNAKVNLEPGRYVRLSMKDTGAGIEAENVSRIFDPYFTTKDIGKGTGMGLAVIYGIVQQHAGGIRVKTEIGKGTTFELYFPAIDSKPSPEEKSTDGISGGKERILFVDDEDAMVNLNRQRLERLGYEVTGLTDPVEALAFFRSNPNQIDLVITDMTMPHMTGDRLSKEILKIRSDMPIILCTGHSSKISEEKAKEIGIGKYIEKPIELANLARSVREILDEK